MHELSMAEGIIKHLAAYAAAHHGTTVKKVTLEIGVISGIDRSSLEFAFPLALEASSMDKLELEIIQVPVSVECQDCRAKSVVDKYLLKCSACASTHVKICAGRELKIKSIEIEEA
ncbi:MAG: hydrogenase maturation nickel metallochaperone HypA [Victivallaceae bacterium]